MTVLTKVLNYLTKKQYSILELAYIIPGTILLNSGKVSVLEFFLYGILVSCVNHLVVQPLVEDKKGK